MRNERNNSALKAFGENVRFHRKAKGLSLEKLGYTIGCDKPYVWKIEKGLVSVGLLKLLTIAKALEVTPCALLQYTTTTK